MERQSKIGFIMGHFAPLHRGHQFLIETALYDMDRVVVLVYDRPDLTPIPLSVRANWIRKLYPGIEVIEGADCPKEFGSEARIMKLHKDYIRRKITAKITHVYSNEQYGGEISEVFSAENVVVDARRERVPISGTAIRENPERYRSMVEPLVFEDMMKHVSPSS